MSTSEETASDPTGPRADDTHTRPAETGSTEQTRQRGTTAAAYGRDELADIVDELQSENRRLRREYERAQEVKHRRAATALFVSGILGVLAAIAFPIGRQVLFILGGTGVFAGFLTWYITPERFITASIGQSVYESAADTGTNLTEELGLTNTTVYVPIATRDATKFPVRLFIPQSDSFEIPEGEELTSLFVLPESEARRGVALRPTAARLVDEFTEVTGATGADPTTLTARLVDSLLEQFELVNRAEFEVDGENDQVVVAVHGVLYEESESFDHPVASFIGTGLAYGLEETVTTNISTGGDRMRITCSW